MRVALHRNPQKNLSALPCCFRKKEQNFDNCKEVFKLLLKSEGLQF